MSRQGRLVALRLQGFKSFGERTLVEFGPGVSAVVGPNGSGKSNLADALRWALGEQGRALRLRRSEDVIFAGSEKRSALGMADVQLVLDNADRLLPVDFEQVELGRRLYRSGENDYLLNRQRVRLKDLVELLDAAHLADNAFLFIGQGMVDQALALRPEERRPLFEEVAGVRRHERRKMKAEEQLIEAEANLARVEDIVAELRPQVRRLAAQAEQQATRASAGREYGRAVLAVAHAKWHDASVRASGAAAALLSARTETEAAVGVLREAEESASATARDLASRTEAQAERRAAHEAVRGDLTTLQLRAERVAADAAAAERDRRRLEAEAAAAEQDLGIQRRAMDAPIPGRDLALAASLAEADQALAEALSEIAQLRAADKARGEELAALRRAESARAAEAETARRRLADARRQAVDERANATESAARLADAERAAGEAAGAVALAADDERAAAAARETAAGALQEAEGSARAAAERSATASSQAGALRGRLDALARRLDEEAARGIAKAARRLGGKLVGDGLQVEAALRTAVEAALGEAVRGYVVGRETVSELAQERGVLVVGDVDDGRAHASDRGAESAGEPAIAAAVAAGGGRLVEAIRVDPTGAALRLLERAVWVPELDEAIALQTRLPAGWIAVTRDGAVIAASGVVTLGRAESLLERRAEVERLSGEVERLEFAAATAAREAAAAQREVARLRAALDDARQRERAAAQARREAEDRERRAARAVETLARESAWHVAQATLLEKERDRLEASLAERAPLAAADATRPQETKPDGTAPEATAAGATGPGTAGADGAATKSALHEWEERATILRARRDELAGEDARLDAQRRDAEARRARAAAAAALDEERIARAGRETAELAERERELRAQRERLTEEMAAARAREERARSELEQVVAVEAATRRKLADEEAAAAAGRERLRRAQERIRAVEVAELEARLGLESVREQLLVELASLGEVGLTLLANEIAGADALPGGGGSPGPMADGSSGSGAPAAAAGTPGALVDTDTGPAMEDLVARAAVRWAADAAPEPPSQAKLTTLRRRFHDLGSANPFAAEEYASVKSRLETLDAQRTDLLSAIEKTRTLIEQLNAMISTQFRDTFRALETAFDARFRQLFGGGFARLSLTEPDDLAATGVEIVARPPGKKAQPLSMLSGGERALTAVALLFSMLEVHPVPFCVLDEVDAALDEANVGRFAEALRGLASQTQFIVITHNRGTIEIADQLYGVTVGDDAVSRVISLRLEEARELADQVSRRDALGVAR